VWADTRWPASQLEVLFTRAGGTPTLGHTSALPLAAVTALGVWSLWRRRRLESWLLFGPLLLTIAAAAVRQYPFADRLILFLVPTLFLWAGEGAGWLGALLARAVRGIAWASWVPSLALAIYGALPVQSVEITAPHVDDVRPVLSALRAGWRPGDRVYVYYGAAPGVAFYAPRVGLGETPMTFGGCHRGAARDYLAEVDAFRGTPRLWVLFAHSVARYREREDIGSYLRRIGRVQQVKAVRVRGRSRAIVSEALLVDLSDSSRLASATAAAFPISGEKVVTPGLGCGHGPYTVTESHAWPPLRPASRPGT